MFLFVRCSIVDKYNNTDMINCCLYQQLILVGLLNVFDVGLI